jgi:hypothetical protein
VIITTIIIKGKIGDVIEMKSAIKIQVITLRLSTLIIMIIIIIIIRQNIYKID